MSVDVPAIRARLEAATPGPWDHNTAAELIEGPDGQSITPSWWSESWEAAVACADAEFIAHAPADIAALLAEVDSLKDALALAMRALDTACGVLQEASGLPDGVDDPDCRDEMVLALRPRAEAAEAERDAALARLAKVEELVTDGGDYHHYVVDGPDGEYVQEGQPCIAVDDIRAAMGGEDA